jgi:sugar/nucleoside kinase (ribokinase family)
MKYDFIAVGGSTEDITFYTKEGVLIDNKEDLLRQKLLAFEYGAKIKIEHAYSTFGGGAANAAVGLAKLGFKVGVLVAIGDDRRGEAVISNFKRHKIDTAPVEKIRGVETGFSLLLVGQSNEHIVFSNRAANQNLAIGSKEKAVLKNAKWIYLTSLSGKWRSALDAVFSVKGPKIAWNPGHIQLNTGVNGIGKYLKRSEIVIVNKDEASELVVSSGAYKKQSREFLENIRNLLSILKSWGPKIVVITNGQHGANAYDGEKFYFQPILKEKKRVDTAGVGDAFGSTFVAGLEIFKGDIQKAMYMSAKNTASVISLQGAQNGLLTRKQILMNIK